MTGDFGTKKLWVCPAALGDGGGLAGGPGGTNVESLIFGAGGLDVFTKEGA